MKHLISLLLALSFAVSGTRAQAKEMDTMANNLLLIEKFVENFNKSPFVLVLADEDLVHILQQNNIKFINEVQLQKVEHVYNGPDAADPRLKNWYEARVALQNDAMEVAKSILSTSADGMLLSIDETNLILLSLLDRYLFEDESRVALSYIFDALYSYKFNMAEKMRIRKGATLLSQYSDGSVWAFAAVAAVVMVKGGYKFLPRVWERLTSRGASAAEQAAAKAAAEAAARNNENAARGKALAARLERRGIGVAAKTQAAHIPAIEVASNISKFRWFSWAPNVLKSEGLRAYMTMTAKNFAKVLAVAVSGGAANIGLHAFAREVFPDSFTNTVVSFDHLRDKYYDGLAVLNLACQSHDYLTSLEKEKHEVLDLRFHIKKMNRIYTEFELLKRLNSGFVEINRLPPDIQWDNETGMVNFKHAVLDKAVTESFACEKLKGTPSGDISVSLNEVLLDLVNASKELDGMFHLVKENRARKEMDMRDVVPGEPR